MRYAISGSVMQSLEIELTQGEAMFTESGGMSWMTDGIEMETNTRGGLMSGLGRALAGESLFMTTYSCSTPTAMITFTPEAPGKVLPVQLAPNQILIAQKDAFMCAQNTVKIEMHFRKRLGAGLFGGEGFILQKLTGPGMVFLEIPGEVKEYNLAAGQRLKVDPGHIAAFDPTLNYDIAMVKGLKNIVFGGEGLFLATLTGPGRVWLQTMPIANLARKLMQYMPTKSS
ncbi:MAG: TIGR00266 family protein [Chloroflexi bacterium HGW-Chloroflexi-10]|nr:MAG: TIGR00266 family protein [Chloroflexi bacterium HGW-Chloroflexi-10]